MSVDIQPQDYRPLFKKYMPNGYFTKKAKELRMTRQNLRLILTGQVCNAKVLDACLAELEQKIESRTNSLQRVKNLTDIHRKLQAA